MTTLYPNSKDFLALRSNWILVKHRDVPGTCLSSWVQNVNQPHLLGENIPRSKWWCR